MCEVKSYYLRIHVADLDWSESDSSQDSNKKYMLWTGILWSCFFHFFHVQLTPQLTFLPRFLSTQIKKRLQVLLDLLLRLWDLSKTWIPMEVNSHDRWCGDKLDPSTRLQKKLQPMTWNIMVWLYLDRSQHAADKKLAMTMAIRSSAHLELLWMYQNGLRLDSEGSEVEWNSIRGREARRDERRRGDDPPSLGLTATLCGLWMNRWWT